MELLVFLLVGIGAVLAARQQVSPYVEIAVLYHFDSRQYSGAKTPPIHTLRISAWKGKKDDDHETIEFHEVAKSHNKYELVYGPGPEVINGVNDKKITFNYTFEYTSSNLRELSSLSRSLKDVKGKIKNGYFTNRPNAGSQILQDALDNRFIFSSSRSIQKSIEEYVNKYL